MIPNYFRYYCKSLFPVLASCNCTQWICILACDCSLCLVAHFLVLSDLMLSCEFQVIYAILALLFYVIYCVNSQELLCKLDLGCMFLMYNWGLLLMCFLFHASICFNRTVYICHPCHVRQCIFTCSCDYMKQMTLGKCLEGKAEGFFN